MCGSGRPLHRLESQGSTADSIQGPFPTAVGWRPLRVARKHWQLTVVVQAAVMGWRMHPRSRRCNHESLLLWGGVNLTQPVAGVWSLLAFGCRWSGQTACMTLVDDNIDKKVRMFLFPRRKVSVRVLVDHVLLYWGTYTSHRGWVATPYFVVLITNSQCSLSVCYTNMFNARSCHVHTSRHVTLTQPKHMAAASLSEPFLSHLNFSWCTPVALC